MELINHLSLPNKNNNLKNLKSYLDSKYIYYINFSNV